MDRVHVPVEDSLLPEALATDVALVVSPAHVHGVQVLGQVLAETE